VYLSELRCPSDSTFETLDQPWLSYYLNGGRANIAPEPFVYGTYGSTTGAQSNLAEFRATPPDWKANGACMTRLAAWVPPNPSIATPVKALIEEQANTLDEFHRGDGNSTTILLSENVNPRHFIDDPLGSAPAPADVFKNTWSNTIFDDAGTLRLVRPWEHDNAFFWQEFVSALEYANEDGDLTGINQHKDHADVLSPALARPASYHPGIVVVTFCDGHTQKLSETMDYGVFARLMSSKGREAKLPGASTVGPPWQNAAVTEADLTP
jgi:hypothetical protein